MIKEEKTKKIAKAIIFVLLLSLLGSLVVFKIAIPKGQDLPRQMQNGEDILHGNFDVIYKNVYSYTEPDHYFANHHWLFGVIAYILFITVGWDGMVIFKAFLILLTFAILFRTAIQKANFWLVSICSVPAIYMLAGRSSFRPEIFGFLFISFFIYALLKFEKNPGSKLIYWLIPIQLLWANIHITFPIGIILVVGFLIEKIILEPSFPFIKKFSKKGLSSIFSNNLIKKLSIVLVALIAISFINPLGISGVVYSLKSNIGIESPVKSLEVQPIYARLSDSPKRSIPMILLYMPLVIITGLSFIFGYRKKQVFYFMGYVATSFLGYFVFRSLPFLGIFFLLAFTANLNDFFIKSKDYILKYWPSKKIVNLYISAIIFVSAFSIAIFLLIKPIPDSNPRPGIGLEPNSEDAAKFFIENNLKGPIFNDTDIGSYLIWYLYPKEKVFSDNRFTDAYSVDFFSNDYIVAITEGQWHNEFEKYHFNTIFMYQYNRIQGTREFLSRRINDPEWSLVYADRYSVILVRNIPENKEIIDKYGINYLNVYDRLSYLNKSTDVYDLVAIADLYSLFGNTNDAMSYYKLALSDDPKWGKIWLVLGVLELSKKEQSNSTLALFYLQQAIDVGWKLPRTYSYLALAYYRLGQMDKALEAVKNELKLDPKSEDAKEWLKHLKK